MRAIACSAVLVFVVLGLGAQESRSSEAPTIDVGQVEVNAEADSPVTLAPAGSVSIVTAEDIAKSGAVSAADALATAPGVEVDRVGPGGATASVSIGGSTSNQVLVIVDGVRLNDSRQGGADLAQIPAESIEKIEVLRGGASAVYGADAVGGVVVITTKKSGARRLSVNVENTSYPTAGSKNGAQSYFDGQGLGLDAGTRVGLADVALSAQAERASNGYPYESGGSMETRDHAGFWNGAANLSVGAPFAAGRLSVLVAGSYQDADIPGTLSSLQYSSATAAQKDSSLRGSLGWASDALAGGALALDVQTHGGFSRLDYADPSYGENDRHDMANGGIDLRAVDTLSPAADLGFGANILYEAADSTAFASRPEGQPTRLTLGAYIEPELRLGDRLKLKPALRYDWNDNYAAGLSIMFGALWKASDVVDIRLSGGRSYRAPTFNELYWPYSTTYGVITGGNPNLKPEVAWSGELGADLHSDRFSLSAAVSARYVDDLIAPISPVSNYIPANIGAAFIPDASIEASYRVSPATLRANYEFLYPLDLSGGKTIADNDVLANYSLHRAGASLDFNFGAAEAGVAASYWSDRTGTALNGATIINLSAAYKVQKGLRIDVAVENLLDTDYQIVFDYPMPGLAIKVGAKIDL